MPMSDKQLFQKAMEVDELKTQIKELTNEMQAKQSVVVNEFERRGIRAFEMKGKRISISTRKDTFYDENKLLDVFGKKLFNKMSRRIPDKTKILQLVSSGEIPLKKLKKCSQETESRAWINISHPASRKPE